MECALKWAVAVRTGKIYLPSELEHHNWDLLLHKAGLLNLLDLNPGLKAVYSALAEMWHPSLRYTALDYSRNQANSLLNQFKAIFKWIEEQTL